MLYSLTITLHDEKITIRSLDGQFIKEGIAVVAYDDKEKVLSVGETSEFIQEKSPAIWNQVKSKVHFSYPFMINNFHPKLAGISANYWAYLASHTSLESQKRFIKDSVDLRLLIPDYEKLEPDIQELFEYYIQEPGLIRVKRLLINDQQKVKLNKFRWAEWGLLISITAVFFILYFLADIITQVILCKHIFAMIPNSGTIFTFFAVIGIFILVLYFGLFVSVAIWEIIIKNFISDGVSDAIIENAKLGLPKPLLKLLRQKPSTQQGSG